MEFSGTLNELNVFKRRSSHKSELQARLVEAWIENFFLKKKESNMENSIAELVKAIRDRGAVPQFHNHVMRKHRAEWPTLWNAIDNIVKEYDAREKEQ